MIRIGIVGFGNLGKAVKESIKNFDDIKLVCIFTKRDLALFKGIDAKFDKLENIEKYVNEIDVMIMCGGSAKDLRIESPQALKFFCIVDSFDTHAQILEHYNLLNKVGTDCGRLALFSAGWDPGIFSMMRLLFESISQKGTQTFWGKGVSQGHSDAIRKINGVLDARSYTIPNKYYLKKAKRGTFKICDAKKLHRRNCFVTTFKGVNKKRIANEIKSIPNYFLGYKTKVRFVSQKVLNQKHSKLFHAGRVLNSFSVTDNASFMEFCLKLQSNPIFTASVMLMFTKAVFKLFKEGRVGAITVLDIPLSYLTNYSKEYLLTNIM